MTRVTQPDSLLTELREIKRRLHALETAVRAGAGAARAAAEREEAGAGEDPGPA